ncbi:MAG: endonuclease III [Bacteroidota bacterium]
MTRKERYKAVVKLFKEINPDAETELEYNDPFQLLISVILSAQCTDERINKVTPALFDEFPTPDHLGAVSPEEVFPFIKSVTYPNNKSKHLVGMAKMLAQEFNNEVPGDIKELQKLPGVGRKTANVIASVIYNQPAMAVDTHVFRVSKRLGLVNQNSKTPYEVEMQLVKNLAEEDIAIAHHWLILHGRYVCLARKPKCEDCKLSHLCRYYDKNFL